MPIDYSKYPKNWKTEIRLRIMKRAKNCCEFCGVRHYAIGYRAWNTKEFVPTCGNEWHDDAGTGRIMPKEWRDAKQMKPDGFHGPMGRNCEPFIQIVLTIAHLDHDIENNDDENLKALCQKCHLAYDHHHHQSNSRATRDAKKGQPTLVSAK